MLQLNKFTVLKRFQSTRQIIYESKPQLGFYRGFAALMSMQGLFWFQYSYFTHVHKENANKAIMDLFNSGISDFRNALHRWEIFREISLQDDLRKQNSKPLEASEPDEKVDSKNNLLDSSALPYAMFSLGCLMLVAGCFIPTRVVNRILLCPNQMRNTRREVMKPMGPLAQLQIETNGFFSITANRKLTVPLNSLQVVSGKGTPDQTIFMKINNSVFIYTLDLKKATKLLPTELDRILYTKQFKL